MSLIFTSVLTKMSLQNITLHFNYVPQLKKVLSIVLLKHVNALFQSNKNRVFTLCLLTFSGHYTKPLSCEGTGPHPGGLDRAETRASPVTSEKMTWQLCLKIPQAQLMIIWLSFTTGLEQARNWRPRWGLPDQLSQLLEGDITGSNLTIKMTKEKMLPYK